MNNTIKTFIGGAVTASLLSIYKYHPNPFVLFTVVPISTLIGLGGAYFSSFLVTRINLPFLYGPKGMALFILTGLVGGQKQLVDF